MKCNDCKDGPAVPLPYRAVFQKPSGTPDENGHVNLSDDANWETVKAARPIKVVSRGGRETFLFDQVQAEVNFIMEFDFQTVPRVVDPAWRILFKGRKIEIVAAFDVNEARKTIRCLCVEGK